MISDKTFVIGAVSRLLGIQVADGVQIGAAGALRGYKDTRIPMLINTFAYWMLAFPLAYVTAVTWALPPNYIWGGFVIGLSVAAILLTQRFLRISRERLRDNPPGGSPIVDD